MKEPYSGQMRQDVLPVATSHILITPLSNPVAKSKLDPLSKDAISSLVGADFGGRGPKASPHTVWPQVKVLSSLSSSPALTFLLVDIKHKCHIWHILLMNLRPIATKYEL